jgi:hypothetical protein
MPQVETLRGGDMVARVEQSIREGNVRRIIVKHEGHTIAEFPVMLGVIGALLAARVVAIGALAAALSDCTIEVIQDEEAAGPQHVASAPAEDVLVVPRP